MSPKGRTFFTDCLTHRYTTAEKTDPCNLYYLTKPKRWNFRVAGTRCFCPDHRNSLWRLPSCAKRKRRGRESALRSWKGCLTFVNTAITKISNILCNCFYILKSMVASNALLKKQSQSPLNEVQHNLHQVKLASIQVCKSVQSHLGAILED